MSWRTLLLALLLLPSLGLPAWAGPQEDEAAYRTRRREGLMRRARERVRPENESFGNIDALAKKLTDNEAVWKPVDGGERYARAQQLIGTGKGDGLIREGARLFRWLVAAPPLAETQFVLRNPDKDKRREYEAGTLEGLRSKIAWDVDLPRKMDLPQDQELPREPDLSIMIEDALPALRTAENVELEPGSSEPAQAWTRPLVHKDELNSRISARFVALRREQRDARLKAWAAEGPATGLQDESLVEAKAQLKQRIEDNAKGLRVRRERIVAALNTMARMEVALTREAGKRIVEMEKAEALADAKDPKSETAGTLEAMRFRQWVEQQELRLLYITVRRAISRISLIDETLEVVQDEELKAAELYQSFESEKRRIRLERMLERVETDGYELRVSLTEAKAAKANAVESMQVHWATRVDVLTSLVNANQIVTNAVQLRETIERRLHPVPPLQGVDAPLSNTAMAAAKAPPTTDEERLWRTTTINLDAKRIQLIRDNIDTIQAPLVAHIYAVADDRVRALQAVGPDVVRARSLNADFANAQGATKDLLTTYIGATLSVPAPMGSYYKADGDRWREVLSSDIATFDRTQVGIADSAAQADRKLDEMASLRRKLTALGPRSFQCRVDRNLQIEGLATAWSDVGSTIGKAERWITLTGDDNAWTFVRDSWWRILLCLGLLIGGWIAAHTMQRGINRWLDHQAERIPELRDGDRLSLDADASVVRQEKERAAAETKAIEIAALDQAAGKEQEAKPSVDATVETKTEGDEAEKGTAK